MIRLFHDSTVERDILRAQEQQPAEPHVWRGEFQAGRWVGVQTYNFALCEERTLRRALDRAGEWQPGRQVA